MRYFETLKDARALDDHRVEVTFKGGRVGVFDCRPYFGVGYYKPLRDPELFRKVCVSLGDLAWPGDIDIGSDDVWDEAMPVVGETRRIRTAKTKAANERLARVDAKSSYAVAGWSAA